MKGCVCYGRGASAIPVSAFKQCASPILNLLAEPHLLLNSCSLQAIVLSRPCGTRTYAYLRNSDMCHDGVALLWVPQMSNLQPIQ